MKKLQQMDRDNPYVLYPKHKYHEDFGTVLIWDMMHGDPPHVGYGIDDFNSFDTHWSFLPQVEEMVYDENFN